MDFTTCRYINDFKSDEVYTVERTKTHFHIMMLNIEYGWIERIGR